MAGEKDKAGAEAEEGQREANQGDPAAEAPPRASIPASIHASIHRSAGRRGVRLVIPIAMRIRANLGGC
jgi:hypothetical protein